ncbi:multi-sensor signal transduction histidine kinase [Oleidesulfovibrio alaskensis G20]|jgi:two-component system nitrogen regulation sensor histidine kinase NtrY|uniref:histidine kinase n=1 Tax=Oleidesulfovibrio alaskensis (strain ATCC BAA-1058 / DSM 17464 / G20) TaxID=207559 RepID=Q30X02_OLEA2|nr:ATP-binding protein [Oleidesulfovibrio alaskensis]ABB39794.1 multi-sensor signal transduction histidine kinase [Oleidesulfovibrio alaskensis G20]MBG0773410.1 HAMP domain-containing protein [Oleidesulfovibrio alaskensis]MBL3581991.1 HAMP domain-containing protein [Oleidesulfovibrio alaskensis]
MTDEQSTIRVSVADTRERKRRQRELLLAAVAFLAVIILTWVELTYLGVDSYFFLALFNLNFILLLLVLFIVVRNGVKLILERRRRVLGSRLRTRLVLAFMSLSLFPTVLMFVVSARFVQTSVDYWFKSQVETSMEMALDVGQTLYSTTRDRLNQRGDFIVKEIIERRFAWGGKSMDAYLQKKQQEYNLLLVGVLRTDRSEQNWHGDASAAALWAETKARIDWDSLEAQPRYWSLLWPGQEADYAVGVLPVDDGRTGYLVLVENIGQGLMYKLDRVVRGFDEYKKLKTLKHPLKVTLYFILGVLTLLIILGAMWFGFRLSKELTAPIMALAEGTERIARGDLTVRLEDSSTDELGVLVQSFNRMTEDLEMSRSRLTDANLMLAAQNEEKEQRTRYIEAVLDNIAAGVVSLDAEGRISTMNKAAGAMFSIDPRPLLGSRPGDLLSGEHSRMFREMVRQFKASPESQWQRQMTLRAGDYEWKLLVNAVGLPTPQGDYNGLVAVFEDITELEKMQRMAAWREVARRIAHEIKNPLTPIKLSAQRLQRKFGPDIEDPIFPQCTELIVRQVEQLQQMVQEFSAFAKLPEVKPLPGDIMPLLSELVTMFRTSHSGITWEMHAPQSLPRMNLDKKAMHRALLNIMTNAAEVLEGRESPAVTVTVRHDKALGLVRVDVADNGPGLSAEERSRLFEPYFSRKRGGTGLGLTIVKSIVQDHRGYVRANAAPDGGTIVTMELPVT